MKKVIWIIIAVLLIGAVGLKIKGKMDSDAAMKKDAMQQKGRGNSTIPVVRVREIKEQALQQQLEVAGEIEAETEIAVQPRISGRLVALYVNEGQAIRINDVLAVLDDESIRLQLQQKEANIAKTKEDLRQAQLKTAQAKADRDRYQELLAKKYISQRDFDTYDNTYQTALASQEGYQAQLTSAQKDYDILKLQLNQTKVYSPVNGFVLKKDATVGMNLTTGSTVVTVAALNPVKLTFNVDQKDSVNMRRGMKVEFSSDVFPDQIFAGFINEPAPVYDPKTRTLSLSANLRNNPLKLVPGMFGTARITIGSNPHALVVPQEAVVTQEDQPGVFVVNAKNIVQFIPVTTGLAANGQIELVSGVKSGDLVVVVGQNRLRGGQEVQALKVGSNAGRNGNGPRNQNGKNGGSSPSQKSGRPGQKAGGNQ